VRFHKYFSVLDLRQSCGARLPRKGLPPLEIPAKR
jgi:hypothetical protein